jgi:hypothetical protein
MPYRVPEPISPDQIFPLFNRRVDDLIVEALKLLDEDLEREEATKVIDRELLDHGITTAQAVGALATAVVRMAMTTNILKDIKLTKENGQ